MRYYPIVLSFSIVSLALTTTPGQEPASGSADKPFKLRWFGQSFFQLETPLGKQIVFDPHTIPAFGRPIVTANIICVSHEHSDHTRVESIEGHKAARVFRGLSVNKGRTDWNTIDEKVGLIRVRTVPTYHDNENGLARGKNAVFVIEAEGLTVAHLGDLGHELRPEQVRAIGPVDVLLLPIGGTYTINGEQAQAVVAALKPRLFVVPMHYGVPGYDDLNGPDEFLDGQPLKVIRQLTSNTLLITPSAQPAAPSVVLLDWKANLPPPNK